MTTKDAPAAAAAESTLAGLLPGEHGTVTELLRATLTTKSYRLSKRRTAEMIGALHPDTLPSLEKYLAQEPDYGGQALEFCLRACGRLKTIAPLNNLALYWGTARVWKWRTMSLILGLQNSSKKYGSL